MFHLKKYNLKNLQVLIFIGFLFTACNRKDRESDQTDIFRSLDSLVDNYSQQNMKEKSGFHFMDTLRRLELIADTVVYPFNDSNLMNDVIPPDSPVAYLILTTTRLSYLNLGLSDHRNDYLIFKRPFLFDGCGFLSMSFRRSGICDIFNSIFDSTVIISGNEYFAKLRFYFSKFRQAIIIANPHFKDQAVTGEKIDEVNCSFAFCEFFQGASFNNKYDTGFMYAETGKYSGSNFSKDLHFDNCDFRGKLDLSKCSFEYGSRLIFYQTPLPDTIDLSMTHFSSQIDLINVQRKSEKLCEINLIGAEMDKIGMQYQNFHLYFPDNMKDSAKYRDVVASTYESLRNSFKKKGFNDSYKKLDIEYKEWQSESDKSSFLFLSNWWWKFGYQKWRILIYTLGLLAIFSAINNFMFDRVQKTYSIENLGRKLSRNEKASNTWKAYRHRFSFAFYYTCNVFFKFGLDFNKIDFSEKAIVRFLLFQYILGIVCTGFLANWILKS